MATSIIPSSTSKIYWKMLHYFHNHREASPLTNTHSFNNQNHYESHPTQTTCPTFPPFLTKPILSRFLCEPLNLSLPPTTIKMKMEMNERPRKQYMNEESESSWWSRKRHRWHLITFSKTILHLEDKDYFARGILFYLYKEVFFRYSLGSLRYNIVNACT